MNIVFVSTELCGGGAARVMTSMANYWAEIGHSIAIVSFESASAVSYYPLSSKVRVVFATRILDSINSDTLNNVSHFWRLRKTIKSLTPDVVVSFIDTTNVRVLLALAGSGIPVIVSERIDPARHELGWAARRLRDISYRLADAVVVQSCRAAKYFPQTIQARISIIENPVEPQRGSPSKHATRILAAGRLCHQKGFDLLLKAFALIANRFPDWSVRICGEGPERNKLEQQVKALQLEDRVELPGTTTDMQAAYAAAGLFVLSSRYEGFPNVLCEAMASGLPTISFDCPSGPAEIVRHGHDGLLVPPQDVEALAAAIARYIEAPEERKAHGLAARAVSDRYSFSSIMFKWQDVIGRILTAKG